MLEALLFTKKAATVSTGIGDGNDGLSTLIAGTAAAGYYGVASSQSMVDGDTLASVIGLTAGTPVDGTVGWLKFSYNSKILYIAKKPFRSGCSWTNIYQCGAVYGDDTNGKFPVGTARLQDARIVIGAVTYRVRLMRGMVSDPSTAAGRENTQLFANIQANSTARWATFTAPDLSNNPATYSWWIAESLSTNTAKRLFMQYNVPPNNVFQDDPTTLYAWRPVLEPI